VYRLGYAFAVYADICKLGPQPAAMALKIIDHGTAEYEQMVKLRDEILRKPLGLTFTQEELESERNNLLIAAYEDDEMLGCCMLVEEEPQTVRLRQMAVPDAYQGKGIGRALMNFAENLARDRGYKRITMHARKNASGFYEKMGYKRLGDEFEEITIPHIVMEKGL
jgi:GNAT superfamily N-acetyltransferase